MGGQCEAPNCAQWAAQYRPAQGPKASRLSHRLPGHPRWPRGGLFGRRVRLSKTGCAHSQTSANPPQLENENGNGKSNFPPRHAPPPSRVDMTPMCDVFDFNPDEGGLQLASLFGEEDAAQADPFDFGSGSPRVKLPKTTCVYRATARPSLTDNPPYSPFDPAKELYSTEMSTMDSWALGSPLRHRSSLSRRCVDPPAS